jgi:hypothetical protein
MSGKNPDKSIGYRNPPDHTKFQPGKSGNLKGRPKQSKPDIDVKNLFIEELLRQVPMLDKGKQVEMPVIQVVARRFATDAMKGSAKALAIFERMTGGFSLVKALELHQNGADKAFIEAVRKKVNEWKSTP